MTTEAIARIVTHIGEHHESDHQRIQSVLTVEQIMTPRAEFLCCSARDHLSDAFTKVPDVYDAVPVVDGDAGDPTAEIVGVLWRSDLEGVSPLLRVDSVLDERPVEKLLAPSTPMLRFARDASANRLTLIGADATVVGLVTVYDLERLPVRLSLFQHLLYLEQKLGEAIMEIEPDPDRWPEIAPGHREKIQEGVARSRRRDHHGSPVLGIGFTEKVEIARNLLVRVLGKPFRREIMDFLAPFRNDVAHGLPFERVEDVPKRINQIDELIEHLRRARAFLKS